MSHEKGRDCARTDEVLENYRRRALAAESALVRAPTIPVIPPRSAVSVSIEIPAGFMREGDFHAQRLIDDANWTLGRRRRARAQQRARLELARMFGMWRDRWRP